MTSLVDTSTVPDIFFCTKSQYKSKEIYHNELDWYVIKGDGTTSKTEVLSPHLSRPPHDCNLSRHVVIGSTIYIIGGYVRDGTHEHYNKTRAVYCIDTRYPEKGWNEIAPMNNARICPSAFVVDGKIYVYGGCNYDRESYVEVYDPICNKWDNVRRNKDGRDLPSGRISGQIVLISGESRENNVEKKVLLMASRTSSLYIYDLVSGSCHVINENLPNSVYAILDGVHYSVTDMNGSEIFAYDLEYLDSTPKSVINMWRYTDFDLDEYRYRRLDSKIVSLGNRILALICPVDDNHHGNTFARKIGCFKFQMVKGRRSNGELYVNANLLTSSSYFVNGSFSKCLSVFVDPLPIDDESEKYMLVNGNLKKRLSSTAYSSAAKETNIDIHQLQDLLRDTMAENEQRIEKRVLQCIKSRFESMETRIVSRVNGAASPQKANSSSSIKGEHKTNQPMQQSRSLITTGSECTTSVADSNTRYSRSDLQTDTKITSLNQVMVDVVDMIKTRTPDIYVCGGRNWYIIKNVGDNSSSQCAIPFPLLSQTPHDFESSAHVVVGSTIYMVGGNYSVNYFEDEYISGPRVVKTRDVYYMDLGDPQPEWKEACPMKNERDRPNAFVVDGKIYVYGGCVYGNKTARSMYDNCDDDPASYVEVYDPIFDKWDNAPPMKYGHRLPKSIRGHMVIDGEGDKEKKVLLFDCEDIYLYEIESGSCQVIEMNRSISKHLVASVIVDGTLYCLETDYDKYYLFAYDLDNPERDPKLVTGLKKYLPSRETNEIHMVSLDDGKLALLWSVKCRTKRSSDTLLCCYKFQMSKGIKANGKLTFDAHLLSFSTDTVNNHRIEKCLTIWTPSAVNLEDKSGEKAVIRTSNNTNSSVNEISNTDEVAIHKEKPQLPYQSNNSEVLGPLYDNSERNIHQLKEMIQEAMAEYEQRTEHHIVQHIEACIESTESRILSKCLTEATTSNKAPSKGQGRGQRFRR